MSAVANQTRKAGAATFRKRSLWHDARDRFMANRAAMISTGIMLTIVVLAIIVPIWGPHPLEEVYWDRMMIAPTLENNHWFGTDVNGRDMFARVFYGARISLTIGVLTTLVAMTIGVTYGAVAGYAGGRIGAVMMRFVDIVYAVPALFLIIVLVSVFGNNFILVFISIGAVEWLTMARIVRGQTLSIKEKDYLEAARALGLPASAVLVRYIIPNVLGPVIVYATLLIPINILVESYLSFLGLGVQEPFTSWGRLISQGAKEMEMAPWLLLAPAVFLTVTMFCFNFIGDGLRDALDPKDR
ncbi:MAG TPA: ABC transporter permease subunit [Gammaproteobacteria bacterium]|jgi:oligopeptide transport system permease protein|nr:peptide ABC transporter permease [Chromatiales bacterium]MCP4927000.1 ABC transporter permease subunit [Gammaproteobacteria bacterium]HJP39769.1 ABC transporter permease subunit [Gammaproteobacteria bacterium]